MLVTARRSHGPLRKTPAGRVDAATLTMRIMTVMGMRIAMIPVVMIMVIAIAIAIAIVILAMTIYLS